jgi:hypothetical protein
LGVILESSTGSVNRYFKEALLLRSLGIAYPERDEENSMGAAPGLKGPFNLIIDNRM